MAQSQVEHLREKLNEGNGKIEVNGFVWSEDATDMVDLSSVKENYNDENLKVVIVYSGLEVANYICSATPTILGQFVYIRILGDVDGEDPSVEEIENVVCEDEYSRMSEIVALFDGFDEKKEKGIGALHREVFVFDPQEIGIDVDDDEALHIAWKDFIREKREELREGEQSSPTL